MKKADGNYAGTATAERVLLGGGGYVTAGVEIADDGWKICGGDQVGCWVRGPNDNAWTPLIDDRVMPASSIGPNRTVAGASDNYMGSWAVDICKGDSTRAYAVINGWCYKFDRSGSTWTGTLLNNKGPFPNSGSSDNNAFGPGRMRIDPQNKDVMAFLTRDSKMVVTTNGGTTMTEIAIAAGNARCYVDVDPTSTVSGGVLQRWFRALPGSAVEMSTTGPAGTYTAVSGSPTGCSSLFVDVAGNCWVTATGASDNLYKWTAASGVFTKVTTATISPYTYNWVAVDPANTNHIVINGDAYIFQSFDGGATWVGGWNQAKIGSHTYVGATSIKWQGTFPAGGSLTGATLNYWQGISAGKFTKTGGSLWCATGIGVVEAPTQPTAATSSEANTFRFYERSEGLDMLIVPRVLYPSGGKPLYATWDRLVWKINDRQRYTNQPNGYRYGEIDGSGNLIYSQLNHGESLEYVPGNPNVVVSSMAFNNQVHAVSYDYGDTWTKLLTHPHGSSTWGTIVPVSLTTAFWFPGANGLPCYTTNLNATTPTFSLLTGTGVPFPTKGIASLGASTSQVLFKSAADWVPGSPSNQAITVTINAASGAGSVVDNAGAKTCVVTPPSGTTTATQLCTYINANSTLITAAPASTGAGAFPTGAAPAMTYESGLGYSVFDSGARRAISDANGNLFLYSYGTTYEAATYRGVWVLPFGANPVTGWVKKGGEMTGAADSANMQMALVPNGTSLPTEIYTKGYLNTTGLYKSTNSGATLSLITTPAAVTNVNCVTVGPVPPGKTRPAIAFAGKYNGVYGIWIWDGTVPGTDAPRKLTTYPLNNPDTVFSLEFNPRAYDPTATDKTLLWGGWNSCGGFALTDTYNFTVS